MCQTFFTYNPELADIEMCSRGQLRFVVTSQQRIVQCLTASCCVTASCINTPVAACFDKLATALPMAIVGLTFLRFDESNSMVAA